MGKTYNGAFHNAKDNLGVKKVPAPSKNPKKKTPLYVFHQTKKLFPGLSKSEVHWYFYVPKREKTKERE